MSVTLDAIQAALGGERVGPDLVIERIAPLTRADASAISFAVGDRVRRQLPSCRAGALIVPPALADSAGLQASLIVTPDPYLYFARLSQWWAARTRTPVVAGVHASAIVSDAAVLAADVSIGPVCVVEAGAVLGTGVRLGAHCFVGAGVTIGAGTSLAPGVKLMPGTVLGARCLLHAGVVIGADGFGFAPTQGRWEKIEQLGGVRIGDDVEIGANTCVDRGALEDTVIESGVKLDNLIQIGHNVHIGANAALAGCVGVAGSATIGPGCTVGGGAVVLGHLELAAGVHISAASVVTRSLSKPGLYSGVFPLDENASWERNAATLRQLHALRTRVRDLERAQTRPPTDGAAAVVTEKNEP